MYRPGIILGVALFICGVLEWVLLLSHYIEFVERYLPVMAHFATPLGIFTLMLVGIVIFCLAWAERRREKAAEREERREDAPDSRPQPPSAAVPMQAANMVANPMQTVSPSINVSPKITIQDRPSGRTTSLPVAKPERLKHNMKFLGCTSTDDNGEPGYMITARFENVPIPHQPIADFSWVRAKIEYHTGDGRHLLTVMPAAWVHSEQPYVEFRGGVPQDLIIAAYTNSGAQRSWQAIQIKTVPVSWGGEVHELVELPLGDGYRKATVTLIGSRNESIEPVVIDFHLSSGGATVRPPTTTTARRIGIRLASIP